MMDPDKYFPPRRRWRVRKVADGRIGWPEVFEYEYRSGARTCVPPGPEVPYTIVIHNHDAYEALKRGGWLNSVEHRGVRTVFTDNRLTL